MVPYLYKERVEGETVESKDAIEHEKAREEEEFKEKQKDQNGNGFESLTLFNYSFDKSLISVADNQGMRFALAPPQ